MKCVLLSFVIVLVSVGLARGCIYIEGKCAFRCPEGTYSYTPGCGHIDPEPTCKNPNPKKDMDGDVCDFSSCYCVPPTVRDESTNTCVALKDCSDPSKIHVGPRPATSRVPVIPRFPVAPTPAVTPSDQATLKE